MTCYVPALDSDSDAEMCVTQVWEEPMTTAEKHLRLALLQDKERVAAIKALKANSRTSDRSEADSLRAENARLQAENAILLQTTEFAAFVKAGHDRMSFDTTSTFSGCASNSDEQHCHSRHSSTPSQTCSKDDSDSDSLAPEVVRRNFNEAESDSCEDSEMVLSDDAPPQKRGRGRPRKQENGSDSEASDFQFQEFRTMTEFRCALRGVLAGLSSESRAAVEKRTRVSLKNSRAIDHLCEDWSVLGKRIYFECVQQINRSSENRSLKKKKLVRVVSKGSGARKRRTQRK